MKIKEFRDLQDNELDERCRDIGRELFNMRLQQVTGQLEKPSRMRVLRRDVARIQTVLRERRNG